MNEHATTLSGSDSYLDKRTEKQKNCEHEFERLKEIHRPNMEESICKTCNKKNNCSVQDDIPDDLDGCIITSGIITSCSTYKEFAASFNW